MVPLETTILKMYTLPQMNLCLYDSKRNAQFWIIFVFLDNPCLKINIFANVITKDYHKRGASVKPCSLVEKVLGVGRGVGRKGTP